jgi:NAD(P)-dependent dehydrogenase (short-subunit alcohol dehydrogenase family)
VDVYIFGRRSCHVNAVDRHFRVDTARILATLFFIDMSFEGGGFIPHFVLHRIFCYCLFIALLQSVGFMDQAPIGKLLVNMECNATASVNVSHYFISKLVEHKQKGCVVFTSSVAGYVPTPFSAMYGATKAFCTQLASCLHVELYNEGIDVCAIHPSPVNSNFYNNLDHKIDLLDAAAKQAVAPDSVLADDMFRSIGACALRDLGGT